MPGLDLESIEDETLLRKMWKEAEDMTEKRNIRSRMFALREQRLRDLHGFEDPAPDAVEKDPRCKRGAVSSGSERASTSPEKESSPGAMSESTTSDKSKSRRNPSSECRGSSPRKMYATRSATTDVPVRKKSNPDDGSSQLHRARRTVSTVEPPNARMLKQRGSASPTRKQKIDIVKKPENAHIEIGNGQVTIDFCPDKFSKARRQVVMEYEGDRPDVKEIQKKLQELGLDALENIDIALTGMGGERRSNTQIERRAVREFDAPAGSGEMVEISPPEVISDADVEVADGEILITIEPDNLEKRRQLMWSFCGTSKPSCAALRQKLQNFTFSDIARLDEILSDFDGRVLEDTEDIHEDADGKSVTRHRKVILCGEEERPPTPPPVKPKRPKQLEITLSGSEITVWVPPTVGSPARQFILRYPHGAPDLDQILCVLENSGPGGIDELLQDLECRVSESEEKACDGEPVRTTRAAIPSETPNEPPTPDGGPELRLRDGQIQLRYEPSQPSEQTREVVVRYSGARPDVQAIAEQLRHIDVTDVTKVDELMSQLGGEVLEDETFDDVDELGRRVIRRRKVIKTEGADPHYAAATQQLLGAEVNITPAPGVQKEEVDISIKGQEVLLTKKCGNQQNEVTVTLEGNNPDLSELEDQLKSIGIFSAPQVIHIMKEINKHLEGLKKSGKRSEKRYVSTLHRNDSTRGSTRQENVPSAQRNGTSKGSTRGEPIARPSSVQRSGSVRGSARDQPSLNRSSSTRGSRGPKVAEVAKRFTTTATHTIQKPETSGSSRRTITRTEESSGPGRVTRRVETTTTSRRMGDSRDASPVKRPTRTITKPAVPRLRDLSPRKPTSEQTQRNSKDHGDNANRQVELRDGEVIIDLGECVPGSRQLVIEYDGAEPDLQAIQHKLKEVGLDNLEEIEKILANVKGEVVEDTRKEETAEDGSRVITRKKVIKTRASAPVTRDSPPRSIRSSQERKISPTSSPSKSKQQLSRTPSGRSSSKPSGRVLGHTSSREQSKNGVSTSQRSESVRASDDKTAASEHDRYPQAEDSDNSQTSGTGHNQLNTEPDFDLPENVSLKIGDNYVVLTQNIQKPTHDERFQVLVTYEDVMPDDSMIQDLTYQIRDIGVSDVDEILKRIDGELLEESDEEIEKEDGSLILRHRKVIRAPAPEPKTYESTKVIELEAQAPRSTTKEFLLKMENAEVEAVEDNKIKLKSVPNSTPADDGKDLYTHDRRTCRKKSDEGLDRDRVPNYRRSQSRENGAQASGESSSDHSRSPSKRSSPAKQMERSSSRPRSDSRRRSMSPVKTLAHSNEPQPCNRCHQHTPGAMCTRKAPLDTGLTELRRKSSLGKMDVSRNDEHQRPNRVSTGSRGSPERSKREPENIERPPGRRDNHETEENRPTSSINSSTESVTESEFVYYSNKEDSPERPVDLVPGRVSDVRDAHELPDDGEFFDNLARPTMPSADSEGGDSPLQENETSEESHPRDYESNYEEHRVVQRNPNETYLSRNGDVEVPANVPDSQSAPELEDESQQMEEEPAVKSVRNKMSIFESKMKEASLTKPSFLVSKSPRIPRKATIWDKAPVEETPNSPKSRDMPRTSDFSRRRHLFESAAGKETNESNRFSEPQRELNLRPERSPSPVDSNVAPRLRDPFEEIDELDPFSAAVIDQHPAEHPEKSENVAIKNEACNLNDQQTELDENYIDQEEVNESTHNEPNVDSKSEENNVHEQIEEQNMQPEEDGTKRPSRLSLRGKKKPATPYRQSHMDNSKSKPSGVSPRSEQSRDPNRSSRLRSVRGVPNNVANRRKSQDALKSNGKLMDAGKQTTPERLKKGNSEKVSSTMLKKTPSVERHVAKRRSSGELKTLPIRSKSPSHTPEVVSSQEEKSPSPSRNTSLEKADDFQNTVRVEIVDSNDEKSRDLVDFEDDSEHPRTPSPTQEHLDNLDIDSRRKQMGSGLLDKLTFLTSPEDTKEIKTDGVPSPTVNEDYMPFTNNKDQSRKSSYAASESDRIIRNNRSSVSPTRERSPPVFRRTPSFKSSRLAKAFEKFENPSAHTSHTAHRDHRMKLDRSDSIHRARDKFEHIGQDQTAVHTSRPVQTRASPEKTVTVLRAQIELDRSPAELTRDFRDGDRKDEPAIRRPSVDKGATGRDQSPSRYGDDKTPTDNCSEEAGKQSFQSALDCDDTRRVSQDLSERRPETQSAPNDTEVEYQENSYSEVKHALKKGHFPYRRMVSGSSIASDTAEASVTVDEARKLNRADSQRSVDITSRESSPQKQLPEREKSEEPEEVEEPESTRLVAQMTRDQGRSSFRNVTRLSNLRYNPDSEFMDDWFPKSRGSSSKTERTRPVEDAEPCIADPKPEETKPVDHPEKEQAEDKVFSSQQGPESDRKPSHELEPQEEARSQVPETPSVEEHAPVNQEELPIEVIDDLAVLEKMLDAAKDYDERFKLRMRIRTVKKKKPASVVKPKSSLVSKAPERSRSPAVAELKASTPTPKQTEATNFKKIEEARPKKVDETFSEIPTSFSRRGLAALRSGTKPTDSSATVEVPENALNELQTRGTCDTDSRKAVEPARQSDRPRSPAEGSVSAFSTSESVNERVRKASTRRSSLRSETEDEPRNRRGSRSSRRGSRDHTVPPIVQEPDEEGTEQEVEQQRAKMEYTSRLFHSSDPLDRPKIQELTKEEMAEAETDEESTDEELETGFEDRDEAVAELPRTDLDIRTNDAGRTLTSECQRAESQESFVDDDDEDDVDLPHQPKESSESVSSDSLKKATETIQQGHESPESASGQIARDRDHKPLSGARPLKSIVDKFESTEPEKPGSEPEPEKLCRVEEPAWLKRSSAPRAKVCSSASAAEKIASSYGVGPTDDSGVPLFGLRALRKPRAAEPEPQNQVAAEEPEPEPEKPSAVSEKTPAGGGGGGGGGPSRLPCRTAASRTRTPAGQDRAEPGREEYSETQLPLFGGLSALRSRNRPDGSTNSLSVPEPDDERAGSDVEEIEARAREQERLLAGAADGAAEPDGATHTDGATIGEEGATAPKGKAAKPAESRPSQPRASMIPRRTEDRSSSTASRRTPLGGQSPASTLERRTITPSRSPASTPSSTLERRGGRSGRSPALTPTGTLDRTAKKQDRRSPAPAQRDVSRRDAGETVKTEVTSVPQEEKERQLPVSSQEAPSSPSPDSEDRRLTSILKKPRSSEPSPAVVTPDVEDDAVEEQALTSLDDVTDDVLLAPSDSEVEEDKDIELGEADDNADGSSPPSTLVQTKSPLVQRRATGGRFSRRTANRLSREEDESRIPLRKLSGNTSATSRSDRLALPSDDELQKLRPDGKDAGGLSEDENDDDGVVLRTGGVAARSTGGSTLAVSSGGGERTSFLDNKTKVTGIRDVVSRMEAANSEPATSDGEARSLLNKFLGAQVMMTGMESMMAAQSGAVREAQTAGAAAAGRSTIMGARSERSQFRSSRAEAVQESFSSQRQSSKTPEPKTEKLVVGGVDISQITDQDRLHTLLEQCDNFDERRKIRGRLMTLMEETRARREQATRRRVQHQQQRDSGCVTVSEAQMINSWLSENFDSKGNETAESKSSVSASKTSSKSVTSSSRSLLAKGKQAVSPFDKFKQLDAANPKSNIPRNDSNTSDSSGGFKLDPNLAAKAMGAKEMTLYWVQNRLRDYQNVSVQNFSTSWNDGMAFCALIHHFYPDAFDYDKLEPKNRRYNFDLAFKMAEEKAGIYPLLDTDDMVMMKKPDWKCVFTYVQAIYRRLKDGP